jgi:hypothetical protein
VRRTLVLLRAVHMASPGATHLVVVSHGKRLNLAMSCNDEQKVSAALRAAALGAAAPFSPSAASHTHTMIACII